MLAEKYYSCGSGSRVVRSGRVVGWLDNLEIMLNSVQLSWKLTELGNFNLISNFDLLISQLSKIIEKYFCTLDGAMGPSFQMKYAF